MGWEANEKDLLKMMQINKDIFGSEILEIESAKAPFLIKYFEKRLSALLSWEITVNSKYYTVQSGGKGDIESISLNSDGFGLNMEQCIDIFGYIYGRVTYDKILKRPRLHRTDSIIVLNFIEKNYPLCESAYSFSFKG